MTEWLKKEAILARGTLNQHMLRKNLLLSLISHPSEEENKSQACG